MKMTFEHEMRHISFEKLSEVWLALGSVWSNCGYINRSKGSHSGEIHLPTAFCPHQMIWGSNLGWVSHFRRDIYKPVFREATNTLKGLRNKSNEEKLKRVGSNTSAGENTLGKDYNFLQVFEGQTEGLPFWAHPPSPQCPQNVWHHFCELPQQTVFQNFLTQTVCSSIFPTNRGHILSHHCIPTSNAWLLVGAQRAFVQWMKCSYRSQAIPCRNVEKGSHAVGGSGAYSFQCESPKL